MADEQLSLLGYVAPAAEKPRTEPRPEHRERDRSTSSTANLTASEATRARLLLVDGDNLVHRYFHAPSNRPPHEALGFALGRLRRLTRPTHAIVVFDSDGPTWRHRLWPAYKLNRPPAPEGLAAYFEAAAVQCRAWGVQQARVEGVEADDLIASYVEAGVRLGCDVTIVSGDKDLLQLVRSEPTSVIMLDEVRDKTWGPAETRERFGVWPHSIADWLALVGDTSDGYPGVPRVGPKTAAQLLEQHGGLEQLLERIELVSSKSVRERLRQYADQARTCFELATLRRDVRLPIPIAAAKWDR